jgi:AAA15 family ATPase/GTPase
MLMRFEVQNFKSFKDNFVFDLSAAKSYEFNPECVRNGLVNKALIYGVNGCGKSNLGFAIFDLISHLTDKGNIPSLYSNYLNAESMLGMAEFKYCFNFNNIFVEYHYGKMRFGVVSWESLKINGKEVVVYRYGTPFQTNLEGAETLNTDLGSSDLSALKYIKSNANLSDTEINRALKEFFKFVDNMLFFRPIEANSYIGYSAKNENIIQDILNNDHLLEYQDFLNQAGIACELESLELNGHRDIVFVFGDKLVSFWDAASTGTKALTLFYFWFQSLKEKNDLSFVFIDEFDAFYHYKLSALIVSKLKEMNIQVILTTHNTSLMTNDLLRPDCCFLMQKNEIAPLYKFTNKELRAAHNIEKMYKAGAFDGANAQQPKVQGWAASNG